VRQKSLTSEPEKLDGKNLERKNYWGELSLWSRRRFGELIKIGREEGTLASQGGRPGERNKGDSKSPLILADVGINKKQAQRAERIAEIPEEDIKEYVAAVSFDDVVAVDLASLSSLAGKRGRWRDGGIHIENLKVTASYL